MTLRPSSYDRTVVGAWSLYDFANSAFTTLVVTFVYATYFTQGIAEDDVTGTRQWSLAVTLSAILVAVLSPYAGAVADRGSYRKRFLFVTTAVCVAATVVLFFPTAGQIWFALTVFVVANVAFEMANVFYNAFLPEIAPTEKIGRISGYGWSLGYLGGLLCLGVALVAFIQPDAPPFGLAKETGAHVRATNLLVAGWYALFSIPLFVLVRERRRTAPPEAGRLVRSATRQLVNTFREVRRFEQIFRLLIARLIYNDGLITIFAFGGIYAAGVFGFDTAEIMIFGIVLNVAAGLGALGFGYVDDLLGGKNTILITLVGLFGATLLAALAQSALWFWVAGIVIGALAGPNQSASRSLLGRFVPPAKENEFYGFFAFSGKFTAFLGPFLLGQFTDLFDSQRAGVATILLFFAVGAVLLLSVDEDEGRRQAEAASPPSVDDASP